MRVFFSQGTTLVLPLFIIVLMADIVSGEHNDGTVKTLLSRPVRRFKILLAKWLTTLLYTSILIFITAVISYVISGIVLVGRMERPDSDRVPSLTDRTFSTDFVHTLPMWEYLLMSMGLSWFVVAAVGTIALMISVIVKNTATGIGIMMAVLISGPLLTSLGRIGIVRSI